MNKKYKFALFVVLPLLVLLAVAYFLEHSNIPVLNPKGLIAEKEYNLLVTATLFMLIIVIPVIVMTFAIAWRYRASNKEATYKPDWDYNLAAECVWWGFPCLIVIALCVITWKATRELDPYKPLDSHVKPITIQVVALQWKWLFIYPEHNIATLNYVQFPEKTPLNFEITSDAPMNSFWIPALGGQIYAMPGMKTKLHLIASEVGSFRGSSANLSGEGFSSMHFVAKACTEEEFAKWVEEAKGAPQPLNESFYKTLVLPKAHLPEATYVLKDPTLFDQTIMKYMIPMSAKEE